MGRTLWAVVPLLAACGTDPQTTPPADAGPTTDTQTVDTPMGDTPGTDVPRDTGSGPTCNNVAFEDLAMLGMRQGAVTRYTGNNNMARMSSTAGLQVPSAFQGLCNFSTTYQRVFRYTMQGTATLRVSTSNPGTSEGFDTTLQVLARNICTYQAGLVYACNDDDPTLPTTATNRVTSRLNSGVIMAGQVVTIAVGGFHNAMGGGATEPQGTFELTVEEVPPIADGAACQRDNSTGSCGPTSSCVGADLLSDSGMCRPNGSAPGTPCRSGSGAMPCDMGLACDTGRGFCYRVAANDQPCERFADAWNRCDVSSTCVNLQPGGIRGVCRAHGTAAGTACNTMSACPGTGLTCLTTDTGSICLYSAEANGPCNTYDSRCPTGQSCVSNGPGLRAGTCRPSGTVAGSACVNTMCSGMGLNCNTTNDANICVSPVMTGQGCSFTNPCPMNNTCYLQRPENRDTGVCFAPGVEGGPCRLTGAACEGSLSCTQMMPTMENTGRCIRRAAVGMPCSLFGVVSCVEGATCIREGSTGLMGTCRAAGTAAGTACRETGTRCDMGLTCTTMMGAGVCYRESTTACDPRYLTTRCPMGQSCRASNLDTGTCAMVATREMEPNDALAASNALTGMSGSVQGGLGRFDVDCYALTIPANGRLFARANTPVGGCATAGWSIDLFSPAGRLLGSNSTSGALACPMIDGTDSGMPALFPWARELPAGTYNLCIRSPATDRAATPDYVLDWNITTAAP